MHRKFLKAPKKNKKLSLVKLYSYFNSSYQYSADLLLDLSLFFEDHDKSISMKLIKLAKKIRPQGPLIISTEARLLKESSKVEELSQDYSSTEVIRDTLLRLAQSGLSLNEIYTLLSLNGSSSENSSTRKKSSSVNITHDSFSYFDSLYLSKQLQVFLGAEQQISSISDKTDSDISEALETNTYPLSIENTYQNLLNAIIASKPYSFIRLGDGEGTFMLDGDESQALTYQNEMLTIWYGIESVTNEQRNELKTSLLTAIKSADLVGVPDLVHQIYDYKPYDCRLNSAYASINEYAFENPYKNYCSAYINQHLLQTNQLKTLLSYSKRKVVTISGHDPSLIERVFNEQLGLDIAELYTIPTEQRFAEKFGVEHNQPHYPSFYSDLCEEIIANDFNDKLVLVGAGFLGKFYCHLIKQQGGIALDIGSVFDYMLGHRTRKFFFV